VILGKKLVSVPFSPYGGVCADNETIGNALVEEAKRVTKECLDAGSKIAFMRRTNTPFEYLFTIDCNYK
jgi:hypothetical protein